MQKCIKIALALLFAPVSAVSVSAESTANMWMRSHQSPTDGQLGELASSNPQAFAIVSALLNKHHTNTLPESERGPDVFKQFMAPHRMSAAATNVAMPYPDATASVSEPAMQEQAPPKSGGKDEVDGLLNMVAGLAGGSQAKQIALLRSRHQQAMQDASTPKAPQKDWSAGEAEQRAAASWHPAAISAVSESQSTESVVVTESSPAVTTQRSDLVNEEKVEAPKPKTHGLWGWLSSGLKSR